VVPDASLVVVDRGVAGFEIGIRRATTLSSHPSVGQVPDHVV
jgi:hypothetical protein